MVKILLHPVFLNTLKSIALLDKDAEQAMVKQKKEREDDLEGAEAAKSQQVWLSEEDVCTFWRVVSRAKFISHENAYRLENLVWRLWHFARKKVNDSSIRIIQHDLLNTPFDKFSSNFGNRTTKCRPIDKPTRGKGRSRSSDIFSPASSLCPTSSGDTLSKSFVSQQTFPVLSLESLHLYDISEANSSASTILSLDKIVDNQAQTTFGKDMFLTGRQSSSGSTSPEMSSNKQLSGKKKKNVDKYLKIQQKLAVSGLEKIIELKEESKATAGNGSEKIRTTSPPQTQPQSVESQAPFVNGPLSEHPLSVAIQPRKISRGFCVPSKKPNSHTSASHSEKSQASPAQFSSVSYEDALIGMSSEENSYVQSSHSKYRIRKQSLSRSVSPNANRAPTSMLTILMNGQLTTFEQTSKLARSLPSPPSRPSAPVQSMMTRRLNEPMPKDRESESEMSVDGSPNMNKVTRRRSTPKSQRPNDANFQPPVHIW